MKKNINVKAKISGTSTMSVLFTIVTVQCINLVAAGTEIITVSVLNNILVV